MNFLRQQPKFFLLVTLFSLSPLNVQATPDDVKAAALAKQNACLGCHAVDKKVVGPSFQAVAKKYLVDEGLTIAVLDPQARQSGESKQGVNHAAK